MVPLPEEPDLLVKAKRVPRTQEKFPWELTQRCSSPLLRKTTIPPTIPHWEKTEIPASSPQTAPLWSSVTLPTLIPIRGNGLGWVLLCSATFGKCLKWDRLQWGAHPCSGSCWSTGYGIPGPRSWWQQWLSAPWKGRKWQTLNNKFSPMPFAIFTTHFRINERLTQKKVLKVHAQ